MLKTLTTGLSGLAGIQYVGIDGISASCHDAVRRLVQCGDRISVARILTCDQGHAMLLSMEREGLIAVKSGFSSGYRGEGPSTFSAVLQLLRVVGVEIDEFGVSAGLLKRLGASALTAKDVEAIDAASPVLPRRWYDYIDDVRTPQEAAPGLLQQLHPVMPWAIVDADLIDLALAFFDGPDKAILDAFRRLEDKVRSRSGLDEHGSKLFSQAFAGEESALEWKGLDKGEQAGRAQLFTGAIQAFRNPRAHRELHDPSGVPLAEFLMVNQLFILERRSAKRTTAPEMSSANNNSDARLRKKT